MFDNLKKITRTALRGALGLATSPMEGEFFMAISPRNREAVIEFGKSNKKLTALLEIWRKLRKVT